MEEFEFSPDFPAQWHYAALLSAISSDTDKLHERMLNKWVPPMDGPYPNAVRDCGAMLSTLAQSVHVEEQDKIRIAKYTPEQIAQLALIWRYNSFGHHTDENALCMYDTTSMMAHSCGPTGVWQFGAEDSFCLRARVALKPGDEITISYLSEEDLSKGVSVRRQKTYGWLFYCECVRCTCGEIDYCRGFRCPTCLLGSVFVTVGPVDGSGEIDHPPATTVMNACSVCNSLMDECEIQKRVALETLYAERLAVTDKDDFQDIYSVYKESLNLFTQQHWVVYMLEKYMGDWLKSKEGKPNDDSGSKCPPSTNNASQRIAILRKQLSYVNRGYPVLHYGLGTLWEELGDCYSSMGLAQEAVECFDTCYWIYKAILGTEHPSVDGVLNKWNVECGKQGMKITSSM